MGNLINLLITIWYNNAPLLAAIQLPPDAPDLNYLLRENWLVIHSQLPPHVKNCGEIVAVEELFEITIVGEMQREMTRFRIQDLPATYLNPMSEEQKERLEQMVKLIKEEESDIDLPKPLNCKP